MRTRRSQALGDALRDLVDRLGISGRIREYDVLTIWPEVVGPHIAAVAEVKSIRRGVLVVGVTSPAWRQELLLRKKELIAQINTSLEETIVQDITFI